MPQLYTRVLTSIDEVDAADWDACANPEQPNTPYNPFLSHAYLQALEASGCVTSHSGWQPCHLVLQTADRKVFGAVPAYLKTHSQGEYVFDHAWANALHRAGGRYYPKLQVSVPFTPVTGRRLLIHAKAPDQQAAQRQLIQGCVDLCQQSGGSSVHMTFMPKSQWQQTAKLGYLQRVDQQYHWLNNGYLCFDEFLADLSSKKRKNLKRERREALQADIKTEWLTGNDLTKEHWDAFYRFYLDTGNKKWGAPYLNREFFDLVGKAMPEKILLILCKRAGRYIAGALNFVGSDTLYGRYWGCVEEHRFLHFEICYYQAIDYAISRQLKRVEAGAGGGHKFIRGYLPCPTYSAHWIADPGFRAAVAAFLATERQQVHAEIAYLQKKTSYKTQPV